MLTLMHGTFIACALALIGVMRELKALPFALLFIFAAPLLAYAYRAKNKGQLFRPLTATLLYLLYLSARFVALAVVAERKVFRSSRKTGCYGLFVC